MSVEAVGRAPESAAEPGSVGAPMMGLRRGLFAGLVLGSLAAAVVAMITVLGSNGWSWVDGAMVTLFGLTLPWVTIGFWNSAIGFMLLRRHADVAPVVTPIHLPGAGGHLLTTRTAIIMPVHNELVGRVFSHLQSTVRSLDATGQGEAFEVFLLSDSTDADTAARELRLFEEWRARDPRPMRLHYRRRQDNEGHKVGNIWEFCRRWGDRFDHMVVLDADSLMSGEALVRLAAAMELNPRLGILQTLAVGLPTEGAFPRLFQFGMRHGMMAYTVGSAWWQGDQGPYWGHNAILRLSAFMAHCEMPILPGPPPFGGYISSHDQVEAVLMRRAGYEVRVLPIEDGSFEENPPTLPEFTRRDLRWCQGNLQYVRLLGLPGLRFLGRVQLALAILMYLSAPFWLGFLALSFGQALFAEFWVGLGHHWGLVLFAVMMFLALSPKIFGLANALASPAGRARYGGGRRLFCSALAELFFSVLMSPIMAISISVFIGALLFRRRVGWTAQHRDSHTVRFADARRVLWPHTLTGVALLVVLAVFSPATVPWALPIAAGPILSIPIAVWTSGRRFGGFLKRVGLCTTPEERDPPTVVAAIGLPPAERDALFVPCAARAIAAR